MSVKLLKTNSNATWCTLQYEVGVVTQFSSPTHPNHQDGESLSTTQIGHIEQCIICWI